MDFGEREIFGGEVQRQIGMLLFGGRKFGVSNNLRGLLDGVGSFLDEFRQSFEVHVKLCIGHAFIKQFVRLPSSDKVYKKCNRQAVDKIGEHGADNRHEDISFDTRREFAREDLHVSHCVRRRAHSEAATASR